MGFIVHPGAWRGLGIGTYGFKYLKLETIEEEKNLVIKHQTKKESRMVLYVFAFGHHDWSLPEMYIP